MSKQLASGVRLLAETVGSGEPVKRQHVYQMRLKMWLNRGDPIRWRHPSGFVDRARLEDNGETMIADLRVDRESLFDGLFKGVQGMHVGGSRRLRISPHLAYGESGIAGMVPENAVIVVEVHIIEERRFPGQAPDKGC